MNAAVALFVLSEFGSGTKSWTANRNRQAKISLLLGCSVRFIHPEHGHPGSDDDDSWLMCSFARLRGGR